MHKHFPYEKDLDGFNEFVPSDRIPVSGLPDAIRDQKSAWLNTISVRAVFSAEVEDGDLVVPVVRDNANEWYHPDTVWVPALSADAVMEAEDETGLTYKPKFYGMAYKSINRVMLGPLVYHPSYKFRAGDILYATENGKMTTEQTEVFVGACLSPGYVLLHGTAQNIDLFKKAAELTAIAEESAATATAMAERVVVEGETQIKRLEELAEQLLIVGVSYNKYAVADISTETVEGTQIALPYYEEAQMSYIVGSNTLLLVYNGTWMLPGEQYEEVGTAGLPSAIVKLKQELRPGDKLGVLILSQFTKVLLALDSGLDFKENGELYIAPVTATGSTEARTLPDRFADIVNVKDFGAKGDGVTDDASAVSAMQSAVGYVLFPKGEFALSSVEMDCTVYFEPGASLIAKAESRVTIRGNINAPKQYIFKGDGEYNLGNDSDSGEQARAVHASWFGAFPSATVTTIDCAPAIQKAVDSVNRAARESIIEFDIGRYPINSTVNLGRACHILGSGIRKTVFSYGGYNYVMFNAATTGCRFSEIQIEPSDNSEQILRTEPCIVLNGDYSQVWDCVFNTNAQIVVDIKSGAQFSSVENIRIITAPGIIDGSAIRVGAPGCSVKGITCSSGVNSGYTKLVSVIGQDDVFVSNVNIENIKSYTAGTAVYIANSSESRNVNSIYVNDVHVSAATQTDAPGVLVENFGTNGIYYVHINNVFTNQSPLGVKITNHGTGKISDIHIDNVCPAVTGDAIVLENLSTGGFGNVQLGASNDSTRAVPNVKITGAISAFNSSMVPVGVQTPWCYNITVQPGTAQQISLGRSIYSSIIAVAGNISSVFGLFSVRAASSPSVTPITARGIETAIGVLTGTTGNSGTCTLSAHTLGNIYIENRTESARTFTVTVMASDT